MALGGAILATLREGRTAGHGGRPAGRTNGRVDGQTDERTDGRTDGRTAGRTDGRTNGSRFGNAYQYDDNYIWRLRGSVAGYVGLHISKIHRVTLARFT